MLMNDWSFVCINESDDPYKSTEQRTSVCLMGTVDKHPRLGRNKEIRTSGIVFFDGEVVRTRSGSIYNLGQIDPEFASWMKNNDYTINDYMKKGTHFKYE